MSVHAKDTSSCCGSAMPACFICLVHSIADLLYWYHHPVVWTTCTVAVLCICWFAKYSVYWCCLLAIFLLGVTLHQYHLFGTGDGTVGQLQGWEYCCDYGCIEWGPSDMRQGSEGVFAQCSQWWACIGISLLISFSVRLRDSCDILQCL